MRNEGVRDILPLKSEKFRCEDLMDEFAGGEKRAGSENMARFYYIDIFKV